MKIVPAVLAAAAALSLGPAQAATLLAETFEGAAASNAAYPIGQIPGTGIEIVEGNGWIAPDATHGNVLDLGSGWYAPNYDPIANIGSSTARSVAGFDLHAGTVYTLTFDYSRQAFSAGNGPFDTALTVAVGGHSVSYSDVVGFYYGPDWAPGSLTFAPVADELGMHVVITAAGPGGYSGIMIDNISWVGVPAAPVPEPASSALLLAGAGFAGAAALRRTRDRTARA